MSIINELLSLLKEVAWPVTILIVALLFRAPIIGLFDAIVPERGMRQRNLRVKMGSFEIESQLAEKAQELIQEVAREPDMGKRLQMIKEPLFLEAAIRAVTPSDIEELTKLYSRRIENAFHVNWYNASLDGLNLDFCQRLVDLGLITMRPMYDGDEVGRFTPTGIALLERLSVAMGEPKQAQGTPR